jgi:hypothetical protein
MNFLTTFRTFAFPEALVEQLPELTEQFGEDAQDGLLTVKTIACGWDDSAHTRLRALRFPETASLTDLIDGRKAYTALWTLKLIEAFENGLLEGVQELTAEEFQALLAVYEEPIENIEEDGTITPADIDGHQVLLIPDDQSLVNLPEDGVTVEDNSQPSLP